MTALDYAQMGTDGASGAARWGAVLRPFAPARRDNEQDWLGWSQAGLLQLTHVMCRAGRAARHTPSPRALTSSLSRARHLRQPFEPSRSRLPIFFSSRDLSSLGAQRAWLGRRSSLTAKPGHDKFHEGASTLATGPGGALSGAAFRLGHIHAVPQRAFQGHAKGLPHHFSPRSAVVADEGDDSERGLQRAAQISQGLGNAV